MQEDLTDKIINQLTEVGTDLSQDHKIELAFFGNWSDLNKLKDRLLSKGYTQDTEQSEDMLIMYKSFPLKSEVINVLKLEMMHLAIEYNVMFDGWSTYPIK